MTAPTPEPPSPQRDRDDPLAGLLEAAAGGDAAAFERFYDATVLDALAVVRQETPDRVEDVLTECYLHAWRCAPQFDRSRGGALSWLLEVVRLCARRAGSTAEASG